MRLSNKSTFSLASLIVLLALGLVFATTSVMAHTTNVVSHTHPLLQTVEKDLNGDGDIDDVTGGDDGNDGDERILAHNTHPKVKSITLKPIPAAGTGDNATPARTLGSHVVITADTDADANTPTTGLGNNQFILIVEFEDDIDIDVDSFSTGELSHVLLNAVDATVSGEISIDSVTAVAISDTVDSETQFEVKITVDSDSNDGSDGVTTPTTNEAIPTGTTGNLEFLTLRIQLAANAVIGDSTTYTPPNQLTPTVIPASHNRTVSTVYEFVLVKTLPESDAPTLAITHEPGDREDLPTTGAKAGKVEFTFTFTDASGIPTTGAGAFTLADDITVTGGTPGTLSDPTTAGTGAAMTTTYKLLVTPTTPETDVTVTVKAGSVTDKAFYPNALAAGDTLTAKWIAPDLTNPTLTIKHKLLAGNLLEFTFTFSEAFGTKYGRRVYER